MACGRMAVMKIATQQFSEAAGRAIQDRRLQAAMRSAAGRFLGHRNYAVSQTPNWEELRHRAHEIKKQALDNLPYYLDQLEASVQRAGGHLHRAADAAEASRIIQQIAGRHDVRLCVKSKSMTSEEIDLNNALEAVGIEAVETDLGEFIIQLAGETPFHIIAPAMHKTRAQVADLFESKLGLPREEDITRLTQIARRVLREKFATAGMGISGVNFAVAETGTIVVVENEGNARLSTTLPKVHVALMGMEKVIPSIADLEVFLTLLPRSATGQKFTSYVSWITGPRRPGDADGPEDFHLVILDNGRSRILADPETRESLYCIRCGACLNVCPVYQRAGGHAYGWVYSGPIGAIITPQYVGLSQAAQLPYASSLCGACGEVCPVKIDIPNILLKLRSRIAADPQARPEETAVEGTLVRLWKIAATRPRLWRLGISLLRWMQPLLVRNGRLRWAPFPASRWTCSRDLPPVARQTFSEWWQQNLK